ncbi:MAG: four helix bundle protein [Candidatus Moraniibacteriota bacterium]
MMQANKRYDLEERTAILGENIIDLVNNLSENNTNFRLKDQVLRSGTSVGANYCEADCAESRKDFEHKLGICKKECKETKHWLRMILKSEPKLGKEIKRLWGEAHELQLIFITIIKKSKINSNRS